MKDSVQKTGKTNFLFPKVISTACISLLCYSTISKLLPSIFRDTGNNISLSPLHYKIKINKIV